MAESSESAPAYHHHNQHPTLPGQPQQHPQQHEHGHQGLPITALVYPHSPSTLSRPFRSRKNRPCDACRRAKTRCAIPNVGPPCVECQQTGKPCTFDEQPPARKRPPKRPASPKDEVMGLAPPRESAKRQRVPPPPLPQPQAYLSPPTPAQHGLEALMHAATRERESQLLTRRVAAPSAGATLRLPHQQPVPMHQPRHDPSSLDMNITPEFEPYAITALFTDDLLPIGTRVSRDGDKDANTDCGIRQISSDIQKPQYIIMSKRPEFPPIPPQSQVPAVFSSLLPTIQPPPTVPALLTLYLTHSNPAFPLFMYPVASPTPTSPPCILVEDVVVQAKVSLTALSHSAHCRPFARSFRNVMSSAEINSSVADYAHTDSQLGSISKTLLDLGAREDVRQNAQRNYLALARTIAQAQLTGLHIDSSGWTIPSWEKDLRSVLWWGLRVHDAWMSFLNSRPSHVQSSNTNVPLPSLSTILHITSGISAPLSSLPNIHFPPSLSKGASNQSGHGSPTSPTQASPADSPTSPIDPALRNTGGGRTVSQSNIDPSLVISAHSFIYLCRLSLLVAQLQSQVCTLSPGSGVDVVTGDGIRSPNVGPGSPPSSVGRGAAAGLGSSESGGTGGVGREERWHKVRAIEHEVSVLLDEVRKVFFSGQGQATGQGKSRKGKEPSLNGKECGGARMETGVISLMMCLLGFRCMLRRISIELWIGLGSPFTPDSETLDMYAEAVEFFCSLSSSHPAAAAFMNTQKSTATCDSLTHSDFDGFWFCYASHVLSSLTSSLIRLSLATTMMGPSVPDSSTAAAPGSAGSQSPTVPSSHQISLQQQQQRATQHQRTVPVSARNNPLVLLCRLVTALRDAKEEANWDMAGPALERAESVARQLKESAIPPSSSSEHLLRDVSGPSANTMDAESVSRRNSGGIQEGIQSANVIAALEGRFEPGPLPIQSPTEYYEPGHPLAPSSQPQSYDGRDGYGRPGEAPGSAYGDGPGGPPGQGHVPQSPYVPREQGGEFVPGPSNGGYPGYTPGPQVYPPHPYGPEQPYRGGEVSPPNEAVYGAPNAIPGHPSSHTRMHPGYPPPGHPGNNGNPGGHGVVGWENAAWGVDMSAFGPYDWQRGNRPGQDTGRPS